jgi:hypothetical protein
MIDELTDYLTGEADRVPVHDTLGEIEAGYPRVAVTAGGRSRWAAPALVGAAAAAVVLIGVASSGSGAPSSSGIALGQASVPIAGESTVLEAPATAATEAKTPATTGLVPIPLPDGGTMQGVSPMCTTSDGIEFDCVVEGYRTAGGYDDGGIDHTGEVQVIVSAASIVSGGCRSTSADGSTWHCALGQRAVDLQMVTARYLGEWTPIGHAPG